jgi:hypothetical protein
VRVEPQVCGMDSVVVMAYDRDFWAQLEARFAWRGAPDVPLRLTCILSKREVCHWFDFTFPVSQAVILEHTSAGPEVCMHCGHTDKFKVCPRCKKVWTCCMECRGSMWRRCSPAVQGSEAVPSHEPSKEAHHHTVRPEEKIVKQEHLIRQALMYDGRCDD